MSDYGRTHSEGCWRWHPGCVCMPPIDPCSELRAEVRDVAADLLEIAELAMPSSYLQTDSRVQRARAILYREDNNE